MRHKNISGVRKAQESRDRLVIERYISHKDTFGEAELHGPLGNN